jgi:hypothetical protein
VPLPKGFACAPLAGHWQGTPSLKAPHGTLAVLLNGSRFRCLDNVLGNRSSYLDMPV